MTNFKVLIKLKLLKLIKLFIKSHKVWEEWKQENASKKYYLEGSKEARNAVYNSQV